jgi:hypothetical protein
MGGALYNSVSRSVRTTVYQAKSVDQIFEQNSVQKIHPSMDPKGLKFRECRDSEVHPQALPIIIALDVTGSMGKIPYQLIQQGLPTLMSNLVEHGVPHAAVCFIAVGDHKSDRAPLQCAQFESGDAELDMFLERTWLEGNGGGNSGESYSIAYYFAAKHTVSDAWEKRKYKGYLFTIGDEAIHSSIPASALKEIFGADEQVSETMNTDELLSQAKEKYNCFHIALSDDGKKTWKDLLGENYMPLTDYTKIPNMIAAKVVEMEGKNKTEILQEVVKTATVVTSTVDTEEIL